MGTKEIISKRFVIFVFVHLIKLKQHCKIKSKIKMMFLQAL